MPVSINKLTVNTKVNKENSSGSNNQTQRIGGNGSISKKEREELFEQWLDQVKEYIDYKLRP